MVDSVSMALIELFNEPARRQQVGVGGREWVVWGLVQLLLVFGAHFCQKRRPCWRLEIDT